MGDSKRSAVPRKGGSLGGVAAQGRAARHGGGLEGVCRTQTTGSRIPYSPENQRPANPFIGKAYAEGVVKSKIL